MSPEERAREGHVLAFQYPVEIPGVSNTYFSRRRSTRSASTAELQRTGRHGIPRAGQGKAKLLRHGPTLFKRPVNEGFSGGEKKRNEIFQMAVLEPNWPSSTKPIPAWTSTRCESSPTASSIAQPRTGPCLLVTHYQRCLNYIVPDFVHVLVDGRIVKSGGKELALELEAQGYAAAEQAGAKGKGLAMIAERKTIDAWLADFERFEQSHGHGRLARLRRSARERFAKLGLPSSKDEEWRFTPLTRLLGQSFRIAPLDDRDATPRVIDACSTANAQGQLCSLRTGLHPSSSTAAIHCPPESSCAGWRKRSSGTGRSSSRIWGVTRTTKIISSPP